MLSGRDSFSTIFQKCLILYQTHEHTLCGHFSKVYRKGTVLALSSMSEALEIVSLPNS